MCAFGAGPQRTCGSAPLSREFRNLDQQGRICAEYVWIDGTGHTLRSKCKCLDKAPKSVSELPVWNFDGSSTGQAPGNDSEVYMVPRAMFR